MVGLLPLIRPVRILLLVPVVMLGILVVRPMVGVMLVPIRGVGLYPRIGHVVVIHRVPVVFRT